MLPFNLSKHRNLTSLSFVYIVNAMMMTALPNSVIPPLLSSITNARLTTLHISLRVGFYSARWPCPFPLDPTEGARYLVQLDDSGLLQHVEEIIVRQRAFSTLSSGGLRLELLLRADLVPILEEALEPHGGWAGWVGRRMSLSESRGTLQCIKYVSYY